MVFRRLALGVNPRVGFSTHYHMFSSDVVEMHDF